MEESLILIVEDDYDISNMLRIFFSVQGYEVIVLTDGHDVYEICRKKIPDLIILDVVLPNIDGYQICKQLRDTRRTANIPVIFLTQQDERESKIRGLEMGANDFITKPFDIQELRLKVKNNIRISKRSNLLHPVTKLPSGILIKDELGNLLRIEKNWTYAQIGIDNFWAFSDRYSFQVSNDVLKLLSQLIDELIEEIGTPDDFIGHASNDTFTLVTFSTKTVELFLKLRENFNTKIRSYYQPQDQEINGIKMPNGMIVPFMRLSFGNVPGNGKTFADLDTVREAAKNALLLDRYSFLPNTPTGKTIKELESNLKKNLNFSQFRTKLDEYFSMNEFSLLCFDLNIEFHDLPGSTKGEKVTELINYCKRHGEISKLLDMCKELRPHVDWLDNQT